MDEGKKYVCGDDNTVFIVPERHSLVSWEALDEMQEKIDHGEMVERWVTGLCCVCKLQMDCDRVKCGCEKWTAAWADDSENNA